MDVSKAIGYFNFAMGIIILTRMPVGQIETSVDVYRLVVGVLCLALGCLTLSKEEN